jgi:hypothetical protein
MGMRNGFLWIRRETSGGILWIWQQTFWFHTKRTSPEEICPTQLLIFSQPLCIVSLPLLTEIRRGISFRPAALKWCSCCEEFSVLQHLLLQ